MSKASSSQYQVDPAVQEIERLSKLLEEASKLDQARVATIDSLMQLDRTRLEQINDLQKAISQYVETAESGRKLEQDRVSAISSLTSKVNEMVLLDQERVGEITALRSHNTALADLNRERVEKIEQLTADYSVLQAVNRQLIPFARGKELGEAPPVVIVNSLPKTGSMTIWKSLSDPALRLRTHHHHAISDEGIRKTLDAAVSYPRKAEEQWHLMIQVQRAADARMDMINEYNRDDQRTPFFISGLREPVALFVSFMFQVGFHRSDDRVPKSGLIDLDRFIKHMAAWYADPSVTLYPYLPGPETWMKREIADFIAIDPLAKSFDKKAGFEVYRSSRGSLLLYRMEDLNRIFLPALQALLGPLADGVEQVDTNHSSDKDYAADYEYVKKNLVVPKAVLDLVYGSKYARTFYSDDEIAGYRQKWGSPRS